ADTPRSEAGDHGTLPFLRHDPAEPDVTFVMLGNGGGDFEYPVADIDCPPSVAPRETVTLDGSASFDPNSLTPLTYTWVLAEAPEGSSADEHFTAATESSFLQTDLAGDYVVTLQVENTIGLQSVPAVCVMDA